VSPQTKSISYRRIGEDTNLGQLLRIANPKQRGIWGYGFEIYFCEKGLVSVLCPWFVSPQTKSISYRRIGEDTNLGQKIKQVQHPTNLYHLHNQ
jgi:hypothetical protein